MTDSDTPRGRGPALAVASAGYFFVLLDVTIVNVALARIGSGLGGSRPELQWVVDAYALVLAAGMLGAGDLADRAGSRRLFLAGLVAFGGTSAACAAAPDAGVLIAARAVQGLGAAAILPSSLAIVNQLFPDPAERPKAIGVWAGLGGSALVLGPVLGGLLVGPLGWRAIFWLNVPLVVAAVAGGGLTLPVGARTKGASVDVVGQTLGTAALAALVFALIEGGKGGFGALPALVGIAVALVAFALPLAALTPFTGRLVGRVGPRLPAGIGLAMSGVGYLGTALVGGSHIDAPIGWAFLLVAGAGMGVAVPGLVAGATEALGPDRAGIASAVNNTSRQVGGAIGVALIGGLSSVSTSLLFSGGALILGGTLALALMGGRGAKPSLCDGKAPQHGSHLSSAQR